MFVLTKLKQNDMREILFKGKRIDGGGWVCGNYSKCDNNHKIATKLRFSNGFRWFPCFDVDPETVCQYTGIRDEYSNRIFEGDVLDDDIYVVFENGSFKTTYEGNTQGGNLLTGKRCEQLSLRGNIHD